MATQTKYELSNNEKQKLASRINYFRTMPNLVLKYAGDLESNTRTISNSEFTNHEQKSTIVGGKVMLLNFA